MNRLLQDPKITTDLGTEPVTPTEAKAWMAIAFSTDDTLITELVKSARIALEKYTGLSFGAKTIEAWVEISDGTELYQLPYGPVTAITSVTQYVPFGTPDALTVAEDYELIGNLLRFRTEGTFKVIYAAGYTALPTDLKSDIMRITAWFYQNRGIRYEANTDPLPFPEWMSLNANRYIQTVI
jgi:uncharacterized phiE125 gp8 family phage protein